MKPAETARRKVAIQAVCMVAWLCVGCTRGVYEIELSPQGEELHREITFWRDTTGKDARVVPAPPDELAAVAREYRADVPRPAPEKPHFAANFRGTTPNDVGGAGWYQPFATPMGALRAYTERFRGEDDLSVELDKRLKTLDRLVDLIAEFLRRETAGDAEAAPLHAFVEKDLRRDMRNLCLYAWASCIVGHYDEKMDEEVFVRAAQYLIERHYFDAASAPQLMEVFVFASDESYAPMLALLQRMVARKLGARDDQPPPAYLVKLFDEQHLNKLAGEFAAATPEYRALLAKWEEAKKTYPEQEKPDPSQVFMDLAIEVFWPGVSFFESADALDVRLKLPLEPFMTNGKWDDAKSTVRWSRKLPARNDNRSEWPCLLYAFWTEPDTHYQVKHFGKVLVDGDALAEYCLWYRGLNAARIAAWDQFVDQLRPAAELADRIKRFHFPGEAPVDNLVDPPASLADGAKCILLQALTGETWPPKAEPPLPPAPKDAPPPAPAPAPAETPGKPPAPRA